MQLAILGASGMLGHKMLQVLSQSFPDTFALVREDVRQKPPFNRISFLQGDNILTGVDASDLMQLRAVLADIKPDYVINCIGIIKQRPVAEMFSSSIAINALLPHKLAEFVQAWGGRVIHFSTDCVFSGQRGSYTEEDASDALDLYGKTKFLGEVQAENALTLRTSMIGRELTHHKSLLDWFLSQNHKTVRGFTKAIYSGLTTNQLADVVSMILNLSPFLSGLYQVVSEPVSKYNLLVMLRDAYNLDIEIVPDENVVCDRSMLGTNFHKRTGYVAPAWPVMIQSLQSDATPYDLWLKN
ncbi:MAG: dTDP-4-dehydrorhamnose reductase family protein [Armatimonadota bacterium]